ncbi:CGNR zinc finger domain-containing protein [Bailinhaonella thermotolerans]|uniref:Zf-CGNR multi-domain protein n=1 Tax=Bailinhaonella thermotolerans TaxID=1070861 RepID=A0A3A4AEJ3_9ACTN|nr:CGNR zinc finger domain-containing protein [Bailinhaonella thermotolerans]RJL25167.1 zf-CGNR multi-domain protein [Bailinhaonella thermotolerans]
MDLTSYAELAVQLVNTGEDREDRLADLASLRRMLLEEQRPHLAEIATDADLDPLRGLRGELRAVFDAVEAGEHAAGVDRLNVLLVRHPIHPQISGHDDEDWHMHLTEDGGAADIYAVGAVMGLATIVTTLGIDRLGVCRSSPCRRVYLDTSSNRSRRYCSERCASRANVAAYRARRRETAGRGGQ